MERTPLIVGNWKMFKTIGETLEFCKGLKNEFPQKHKGVEIAVGPPFTALKAAVDALSGSGVSVSAQDVFWAENGAYTGEVSPGMLADAGCKWAIVGHSERRQYFHETDESVNKKAAASLKGGIIPIVCVGETLSERKEGATFSLIEKQIRGGLKDLAVKGPAQFVIAYEPVWAIGTGQTATPAQAQEVHAFIRSMVKEIFGSPVAEGVRILYGGSVKPANIAELMAMADIDGALVGGASLEVDSFIKIIRGASSRFAQ
jgi:triosephosphate isomerase